MAKKRYARPHKRGKKRKAKFKAIALSLFIGAVAGAFALSIYINWERLATRLSVLLEADVKGAYTLPFEDVIGIDISYYQGDIDWEALQFNLNPSTRTLHKTQGGNTEIRKVDFVIAKASEGVEMKDRKYAEYKKKAQDAGIVFGAYHFFIPGKSSSRQAANFIEAANLNGGNLIPFLDVEKRGNLSSKQMREGVLGWLQAVENHYGKKPVIYTNLSYYKTYFADDKRFNPYKFWIAAYSRDALPVNWLLWQQSELVVVGGIKGFVDINVFSGSALQFKKLKLN